MKLYNSESRLIEEFIPHNKNEVTLYTCGPTVYHFAHIGNLRSYIMEDILERAITYLGYKVKRAMNITDVGHLASDGDTGEDRMLIGAKREHKTILEIANEYTQAFKKDCEALNLKWPSIVVPATDCIENYIKIISKLLESGYAYKAGENIYFDTSKLENYYRFGNQTSDDMLVGARETVDEDKNKRNKNDFVLWFTKSKFENHALKWDSPWGVGYPGWHIECSGISNKYLGEFLDIHCGGVDNKFPHHTNEIAQTESYVGHKWCNYWFHVEHLNTASGKMSKSKGGFTTLTSLVEGGYSPMVYKFFCLQSHYRKPLMFSIEGLDSAKTAYNKLLKRIEPIKVRDGKLDKVIFEEYNNNFKNALSNDLNTAQALTVLFDVLKANISNATKVELVKNFDTVLNLDLLKENETKEEGSNLTKEEIARIEKFIKERAEAKQNKNYARADEIRASLFKEGIELIDTKEGTKFIKK